MKLLKSENSIILLMVFALACLAGMYINFVLDFVFIDAFKRSFMAYLVYFGNEPKLSAIGFVWPPIPTLLQLPLVAIEPLNRTGIAGNILSAIFLGISAVYLNSLGKLFNVKKLFRYAFTLLFVANPLIFFYGANGMSELIAISFIIMTIYYFLRHIVKNSLPSLLIASLTLSCLIMTRWEMGLLLFVVLSLIAFIPFVKKNYSFNKAESSAVMFILPVMFIVFIWLFASWLIVGSPTYFLNSSYSFTPHDAKQLASNTVLSAAKGNILLSIQFVMERILFLSAVFFPFLILVLAKLRNKANRISGLTIVGFALSVIFAHTMLVFLGKSYGELRYFIYVIPFSYIFLLFLFKDTLKTTLKNYKYTAAFLVAVVLMLATSGLTYYAMLQPKYGNQEYVLMNVLLNKNTDKNYALDKEEEIAKYISANVKTRSVIVDDSVGFTIVYLSRNPNLFIETVDSDFKKILNNPINTEAKYMLISDQNTHSGIDILNEAYPKMFEEGEEFVTLEKDWGDWKLYKIKSPTEIASSKVKKEDKSCKHTVLDGESVWNISSKYFGSGEEYNSIVSLNKDLATNPSMIKPNQEIIVPCS